MTRIRVGLWVVAIALTGLAFTFELSPYEGVDNFVPLIFGVSMCLQGWLVGSSNNDNA